MFTRADYDTPDRLGVYLERYQKGIYQTRIDAVRRYFPDLTGKLVLDLGSGTGYFSNMCAERGAKVLALDWAYLLCKCATESYGIPAIQGNVLALPFLDRTFDMILNLDVIEHLYEPNVLISEVWRTLVPAGLFLLMTDNRMHITRLPPFRDIARLYLRKNSLYRQLREIRKREKVSGRAQASTHVRIYTVDEILSLLTGHRFKVLDFDTFHYIETEFHLFLYRSLPCFFRKRYGGSRQVILASKPQS